MYNETIMILSLLTLIIAPTTTIVVALVNNKTVNKKLLKAQTDSAKQKKVANIYYERRAEALLSLYEDISVEYNSIFNLLHWILRLQTDKFAREEEIHESYSELISKNNKLWKVGLQSKIFLNKQTYDNIHEFVSISQEYVSLIVDCFELYKKIDPILLEEKDSQHQEYFMEFIQEVIAQEVYQKFQAWENEITRDLDVIKSQLKEVLKSPEIV
jgi:hypothetical protein